ncbi:MAG: bifunctional phosphoglucose/phosphomannose isomerase [Candidatus Competibacteraceae bacterium]|nr:bifunctional phosphoglucose/phosphomannose isomerase [Candidatus Competibacteraceae bacterium]
MKSLIKGLPQHIEKGLEIFSQVSWSPDTNNIKNIVISGLGGSGIGGSIAADLSRLHSSVPVCISKDYHIPAFIGPDTLFIASSYSGDTEETLSSAHQAIIKGANVICITSGGKLSKLAIEHRLPAFIVPGGYPPRACLGYSLSILICILQKINCLPSSYSQVLKTLPAFLTNHADKIIKESEKLARQLFQTFPIIYADSSNEGIAVRFRQQLNENAKMLASHHVIPEMNHNELVGWSMDQPLQSVVFLRTAIDYTRNQARVDINSEIISQRAASVSHLWSEGDHPLEHVFYLIHFTDWVSYFLAEMNGVDIMDIQIINELKQKLSNLQ